MRRTSNLQPYRNHARAGLWLLALLVVFAFVGMTVGNALATVYVAPGQKAAFENILDQDEDDGGADTHQTVVEENGSLSGEAASFRVAIRPVVGWTNTTTFNFVIYDTQDDGDSTSGSQLDVGGVTFIFFDEDGNQVDSQDGTIENKGTLDWHDPSNTEDDAITFTVGMPEPLGTPTKFLIRLNNVTDCAGNTIASITFPDSSLTRFYSMDLTAPSVTKVGISNPPSSELFVVLDRDVYDRINNGTGEMIASSEEEDVDSDHFVANQNATSVLQTDQFAVGGNNPTTAERMGGQFSVVKLSFGSEINEGDTLNWSGGTGIKDLAGRPLAGGSMQVSLNGAPQVTDVSQDSATEFTVTFDNTMKTAGDGWELVDLDNNNEPIDRINWSALTLNADVSNGKIRITLNQGINTDGTVWATATADGFVYSTMYLEAAVPHRVALRVTGDQPTDIFNADAEISEPLAITTDKAQPKYLYAGTTDRDLNGQIDGIVVYLSEPVTSSGLSSADFVAQETETDTPTNLSLGTVANVSNSYKILIPFTETPSLTGGTAETDIRFMLSNEEGSQAAFTLTDAAGNQSVVNLSEGTNDPEMPHTWEGVADTTGPVIKEATVDADGTQINIILSEDSRIGGYEPQRVFVITDEDGNKIEFEGNEIGGGWGFVGTNVSLSITSSSEKVVPGDKIYIYTYPTNNTAAIIDDNNGWPRVSTKDAPVELKAVEEAVVAPQFQKAIASDSDGDGFFDKVVIYIYNGDGDDPQPVNVALKRVDQQGNSVTNAVAADFENSFAVYNSAFNEKVGATIAVKDNTIELTLTHPSQVADELRVIYDPAMNQNNAQIVNAAATNEDLLEGKGLLAGFDEETGELPEADEIAIVDQDFNGYVDGVRMTFYGIELQDTTETDGVSLQYLDESSTPAAWVDVPVTSLVVENEKDDEGNPVAAYVTVSFDEASHKILTGDTTHLKIYYAGNQLVTIDGDQIGVFGQDGSSNPFKDKAAPAILKATCTLNELGEYNVTLYMSEKLGGCVGYCDAKNYVVFTDSEGNLCSLEDSDARLFSSGHGNTLRILGVPFDPSGKLVKFYMANNQFPVEDTHQNEVKTTAEVEVKGVVEPSRALGQKDAYGFYDRVVILADEPLEVVEPVGEGKDITEAFLVKFNDDIEEHPTAVSVDDDGRLVLTLATRLSIANDDENTVVIYHTPLDVDDEDAANDSAYVKGVESGKLLADFDDLTIEHIEIKADEVDGGYTPFILNLHGKLSNFPAGTKLSAYLAKVVYTVRPVDWSLTYKGVTITSDVYLKMWGDFWFWPYDWFEDLDLAQNVNNKTWLAEMAKSVFYLHTDGDGDGLVGDYKITLNDAEATSDNAVRRIDESTSTSNWTGYDWDEDEEKWVESGRTQTSRHEYGHGANLVSDEQHDEVVQLRVDWKTGLITTAKGEKIGRITLVKEPKLYVVSACGYGADEVKVGSAVAEGENELEYSMAVYGSQRAATDGGFCVLLVAELPDGQQYLLSGINPADSDAYIAFAPQFASDSATTEYDVDLNNIQSYPVGSGACGGWNFVPIAVKKVYKADKNARLPLLPSWVSEGEQRVVADLRTLFVGLNCHGVPTLLGYNGIISLDNLGCQYQLNVMGEVTGDLSYVVGGYGYMVQVAEPWGGTLFFFGEPIEGSLTVRRSSENYGWNLVVGTSGLSGFDYAIGFDPSQGANLVPDPTDLDSSGAWLLHLESGASESTLSY